LDLDGLKLQCIRNRHVFYSYCELQSATFIFFNGHLVIKIVVEKFSGVASYGAVGHVPLPPPPDFQIWQPTTILVLCSQQLSSFDQYCISHKTH